MARWKEGDVFANGVRLHYYRTGGDKPQLVLAHGFTDNGLCWTPIARALEEEYDIIMYDARGHGLSDAPESDYSYQSQAADLAGLVEALGLERPAVLGHSMGAVTAALAAAENPGLMRCILLEDPPFWSVAPSPLSMEEQEAIVAKGRAQVLEGRGQPVAEHIARGRAENPLWTDDELLPWAEAKRQLAPNVFRLMTNPYTRWQEIIGRIHCPVLLITGDTEMGGLVTPDVALEIEALLEQGRVTHIPGAGHSIRREQRERYLEAVQEFLREM